ncbi:hypothetical protein Asppvi_003801 [Aspergillus pseudoviridinutans]|uniref:Thioesterase domain-containing protein n=1 Tax=Aspergillus pseudoviridinutans TaxID=1517512 RepID=A0A9P3B546_9EURO|nr:uncharacterized protein Asppvi_003801 [Aspergillus pseudoviridinutans]GIJ84946.1 hypothetical protein Asppvi_003801 [Aspergillus pseudoviridinutans]
MSHMNGPTIPHSDKNILSRDATAALFTEINKTPDFLFEALELCDATASYIKAKVKVPADIRFHDNWGIIGILFHQIMSKISGGEKILNTNTYYLGNQNCLRPGVVLVLMAHRVGESLLEAQVSSAEGSLIARTSAIYSSSFPKGDGRRFLDAPINFETQ